MNVVDNARLDDDSMHMTGGSTLYHSRMLRSIVPKSNYIWGINAKSDSKHQRNKS
jgi:hypothetical protein